MPYNTIERNVDELTWLIKPRPEANFWRINEAQFAAKLINIRINILKLRKESKPISLNVITIKGKHKHERKRVSRNSIKKIELNLEANLLASSSTEEDEKDEAIEKKRIKEFRDARTPLSCKDNNLASRILVIIDIEKPIVSVETANISCDLKEVLDLM